MLILQNILYCLLFLVMVKCLARSSGKNCMYFYPEEFIAEAARRGLVEKDALMKKGKRIMVPFCLILFAVLVCIIAFWNHVTSFRAAFWQAYLFLVVMNWFDGIVLDRLWVAHGKLWVIASMEGVPYIKPWKTVLLKRGAATVLYLAVAAVVAGVVVLVA